MIIRKFSFSNILYYLILVVWLVFSILPFYFMIISGFKSHGEIITNPNVFSLPKEWLFSNYLKVLEGDFLSFFKNSLIITTASVFLVLALGSMTSFVLARMNFKFSRGILSLAIFGMAIPIHITLIPVFTLTLQVGLYDTLFALIGPYVAFNLPLTIFILTEFMRSIPKELEESASIDGANFKGKFFRIILPLSKPGIFTMAIYNAIFIWNEFLFVLVLIASTSNRTLPLAIWNFQGRYQRNIPLTLAFLTLSALPIILVYFFGQERIIKGMMAGAIKG